MTARDEIFRRLTKQDQIPVTDHFADLLLDAYAHELAEQIRRELPDPNPLASIFKPYAAHLAADLIDPKEHPMSHEKTDDETTYDTDEWTHDGHDEDQDETD